MVFVYTRYRKKSDSNVIERGSAFPAEASEITICANSIANSNNSNASFHAWNSDESNEYSYEDLSNIIQRSPVKIPNIRIYDFRGASPEYLALLVAILKNTDSLTIESLGGDAAYGCFMGSMLQQNGLRELHISSNNTIMSTYQAKLLFEGIAVCPSLKKLNLTGNFSEPAEAGTALASALKRNNSLVSLDLYVNLGERDTALGDLFKAAIVDKSIHNFTMIQKEDQQLPYDVMAEVLCTEQCTVKELDITTIEPAARAHSRVSNKHFETLQNKSVTCYHVCETSLDCSRIMETVSLFRSLKKLDLSANRISDLSPLDPLLIGDNLTLETLRLIDNRITEKDAIDFFRKLPKMTCLRRVQLTWNPFNDIEDSSWDYVLEDIIWQNRSLECINCINDGDLILFLELNLPLSLNRGGRRALEIESPIPLPANLWPNVLERAGKLSYFSASDDIEGSPSLESTRPDVVYWLLKEKMLGSCLLG